MTADAIHYERAAILSTWDALQTLGFQSDDSVLSEGGAGLAIDLGKFRLTAGQMLSFRFAEVVVCSGLYVTPRRNCNIEFEMPAWMETKEQCAAWIAWNLKDQLPDGERVFSLPKAAIVFLGFQHQDTLPWVREASAYATRPCCTVERSWLRQAIRQLGANVIATDAAAQIVVGFDGRVLTFHSELWAVPVPA